MSEREGERKRRMERKNSKMGEMINVKTLILMNLIEVILLDIMF